MTTKISDIYDALDTLISTALTGYIRLPDPYNTTDNPELYLRKSYGIAFSDDTNTNRKTGCNISISQDFVIPLINAVYTTDTNSTAHASTEKALLEDKFKVIKALELDNDLGGKAMKAAYVGSSAISYLEGDRDKYIFTELLLSIEYLEVTT